MSELLKDYRNSKHPQYLLKLYNIESVQRDNITAYGFSPEANWSWIGIGFLCIFVSTFFLCCSKCCIGCCCTILKKKKEKMFRKL